MENQTQLIYKKIPLIMAEVGAIKKERKNQSQGYAFRGIDDVYFALNGVLSKHGVFTTTEILNERTEDRPSRNGGVLIYRVLTIKFRFYAEDGSFVDSVIIGEGMDNGDKASNKAMSVAHKYALLQIFSIPTDEPKDPENESHEVIQTKAEAKAEPKNIVELAAQKIEVIADNGYSYLHNALQTCADKKSLENVIGLVKQNKTLTEEQTKTLRAIAVAKNNQFKEVK